MIEQAETALRMYLLPSPTSEVDALLLCVAAGKSLRLVAASVADTILETAAAPPLHVVGAHYIRHHLDEAADYLARLALARYG